MKLRNGKNTALEAVAAGVADVAAEVADLEARVAAHVAAVKAEAAAAHAALKAEAAAPRPHECGHVCELWALNKCCACSDKRPRDDTYIAYAGSYLADVKRVERSYHYCPTCKNRAASRTPPRKAKAKAQQPKLDFSKWQERLRSKAAAAARQPIAFTFPPSVEQQLADAKKRIADLEASEAALKTEVEQLKQEIQKMNDEEEYEEFCREYYDVLRSHWNVAGEEMHEEFERYKKMGESAYKKILKKELALSHHSSGSCYECNWLFGPK